MVGKKSIIKAKLVSETERFGIFKNRVYEQIQFFQKKLQLKGVGVDLVILFPPYLSGLSSSLHLQASSRVHFPWEWKKTKQISDEIRLVFSDIESEAFMSRLSSYSVFTKMLTVICAKSRFSLDSNEADTSKNWIYSSEYPYTYIHSIFIWVFSGVKRI